MDNRHAFSFFFHFTLYIQFFSHFSLTFHFFIQSEREKKWEKGVFLWRKSRKREKDAVHSTFTCWQSFLFFMSFHHSHFMQRIKNKKESQYYIISCVFCILHFERKPFSIYHFPVCGYFLFYYHYFHFGFRLCKNSTIYNIQCTLHTAHVRHLLLHMCIVIKK